ncbi:MAG: 2Fe-2S iron-sulfur cluster-binding protein [Pseudorhodoplanes sp.]
MSSRLLDVRLVAVRYQADDIRSFELADPDGRQLPAFEAGSHVDLHLPGGLVRQYSLCNDPSERHRYVIAVLREQAGRGGSRHIFQHVDAGDLLRISQPRNNFPLATEGKKHVLLAGGIGVTPMMAMVSELRRRSADFVLHYCTRSPERTAFRHELAPLVASGQVRFHHDGGDPAKGLDLAALLRERQPGTHVYYCGPPGFMSAARIACDHWPRELVHLEHFTSATDGSLSPAEGTGADEEFQVQVKSTGAVYDVPRDKSITTVLREHGIDVETSCESGLCGTCRTRYLAGEPEHRDLVLDDAEKGEYVLICCARSKTPLLVLDI